MVFVTAGCKQEYKEDISAYGLLIDPNLLTNPNFIVPDYASRAIEATGGRQAWMKAKKLSADCVVTFYQPDVYLTERYYEIYPWSNSIRISAEEPQGGFVWQLSDGVFSTLEGAELTGDGYVGPVTVVDRSFAEVIISITTAPVRFLDRSVKFTKEPKPVKIKGQWYYPIKRTTIPVSSELGVSQPAKAKTVFYQNRDNSLVNLIWIASKINGGMAVQGYDYHEVEKNGVWLPAKIEIFTTDATGALEQRLVKIDFK
jgi:hypothetical protein